MERKIQSKLKPELQTNNLKEVDEIIVCLNNNFICGDN